MKRKLPLVLVLIFGLCSCTTPVSQLKLPKESTSDTRAGGVGEETSGEAEYGSDDITDLFPPMIGFGAVIMNHDGLTGSREELESDFLEKNGFSSGAGSANTYSANEEGEALGDHLTVETTAGQKNLVQFACQGVGAVRLVAQKDGQVVAEKSLRCSIPANEISMEFVVPQGGEAWIVQEPTPETRGIYEVMFYG